MPVFDAFDSSNGIRKCMKLVLLDRRAMSNICICVFEFVIQWHTWRKARTAWISGTYWWSFTSVFWNMSRVEFWPFCKLPSVCWWAQACASSADFIQSLQQALEVCI